MILDDRELLERWVSQRDAEAFKSLAKRYADMVFATSRRILRNDTDAEDVVQECFATLIRSGSKPASYLGPWLHRVATNTSLKRLRAERRRRTREDSYTREQSPSPDSTLDDALALVDQAIAELPEKQRLAIVAYFLEDKTHETIAEAMGITRPGVAYRIQKGIESVRKSLKRSGAIISVAALSTALSEQTAVAAPHSLNAALGKLALGGTDAAAYGTSASAMAKTLGGLVAMKTKSAVVIAVILALITAGVVWFSLGNDSETVPTATPLLESESSEDASTALEQVASLPSESDSPGADADDVAVDSTGADEADIDYPTDGQEHADAETSEHEEQSEGEGETGASISGHVLDDQGFPIEGARVVLAFHGTLGNWHSLSGERMTRMTDADGYFMFAGITSRDGYVSASAFGFRNASKELSIHNGQDHEGLRFVLFPGTMLVGKVVSSSGNPIEGAIAQRLGFASGGNRGSGGDQIYNIAITDENGLFAMGFESAGNVALRISGLGQGGFVFSDVPVGLEEPIEFRMEAPPSLSGTITRADGTPGAGLVVLLQGYFSLSWTGHNGESGIHSGEFEYPRATTGEDGRYRFESLSANTRYMARVQSPYGGSDLSLETDLGVFGPGDARTWDLALAPTIRVTGSVTGKATGSPVKNIGISYVKDGQVREGPYLWNTHRYELLLSEPGTYYIFPEYFNPASPQATDTYGQEVTLAVGEEREVNFKVPDQFTLSIQVVDASGKPIPGARVGWAVNWPGFMGRSGYGQTDGEGRHSHGFVPNLESWFSVHKDGYASTHSSHITGEPAAEYPEEVVVLHTTGGVEGIAVDSAGNPLPHAQLKIALRAEGVSVFQPPYFRDDFIYTTTDGEGVFAIGDGFPAVLGDVHIQASLDNGDQSAAAVHGDVHIHASLQNRDWSASAVVSEVECIAGEVVNLGAVVFEEEQRE